MRVAVTTCPGREYLEGTLASLQAAGFDDVKVFHDANRRGSSWNYWSVFYEASHDKDSLLIVQDDVLVHPRLHALAHAPIPPHVGVVTFHDFAMDFPDGAPDGEYVLPVLNLEGAQCLLFPHESVEFLAGYFIAGSDPHNVDFRIGGLLAESRRPNKLVIRSSNPPLVEHVGRVSACHPGRRNFPQAGQTVHDLPCLTPEDPPCKQSI